MTKPLPDRPKLMAIFGSHPDIGVHLRNASWAARERNADAIVLAEAPDGLGAAIAGVPSRSMIETWAGRQHIPIEFYRGSADLERRLSRLTRGSWAGVMAGPKRRWPFGPGLSGGTQALISRTLASANVALVPLSQQERAQTRRWWTTPVWRLHEDQPWYHDYVMSALAVSLVALITSWLVDLLPPSTSAMLFLPAVIYAASAYGFAAALFATVFGLGTFDYFFLEPRFAFSPPGVETLLPAALFVLAAAITSNLAGGLRIHAHRLERQAAEVRALFSLTREIASARDTSEIFAAIVKQCEHIFEAKCSLLAPHQSTLGPATDRARSTTLQVEIPRGLTLSAEEIEAARLAYVERRATGLGTSDHGALAIRFQPLVTSDGPVAVLGLSELAPDRIGTLAFERLIDAICRIAGIAVERTLRSRELETSRVIAQTEGLRSALLSSISHDFGTPLASIIGSASSLISFGDTYAPEVERELLDTILEEAERLNRFVKNVLQMNKLESGALVPRLQWADVGDLIGTALDACQRRLHQHEVYVDIAEPMPLAHADFVLMETVLVNLLDNAAKYSPPETDIQITARTLNDAIIIDVTDRGRGIAADELGAVFDKFYRAKKHRDRAVPGTGLGLAICKGIVEAHHGTIEALSPGLDHGTTIRMRLPVETPSAADMAEA